MTDFATGNDGDHFWSRVRAALDALKPAARERIAPFGPATIGFQPDGKSQAEDPVQDELSRNWANAAARAVPMSLLVIEIDRMGDYLSAYGRPTTDHCIRSVMQAIADALPRDGDLCLRMGQATFVVALPDLPMLRAESSAGHIGEAIRRLGLSHKESHAGLVTASMGLAVTEPSGEYDPKFFATAKAALRKAQRKGLGRLHAVDLCARHRGHRRTAA